MNIEEILELLGKYKSEDNEDDSLTTHRTYKGLNYSLYLNEFDEWEANYNQDNYSLRTSNSSINECISEMERNIDTLLDKGYLS